MVGAIFVLTIYDFCICRFISTRQCESNVAGSEEVYTCGSFWGLGHL